MKKVSSNIPEYYKRTVKDGIICYYIIPSDKKTMLIGKGIWCEEPDWVEFIHNGIECYIRRVIVEDGRIDGKKENPPHFFGGHFCGYCKIKPNHPLYKKDFIDIDYCIHEAAHGGITYSDYDDNGDWVVGYDCGHSGDVIPSMEQLKRQIECDIAARMGGREIPYFLRSYYRDVNYNIEHCKELADAISKME